MDTHFQPADFQPPAVVRLRNTTTGVRTTIILSQLDASGYRHGDILRFDGVRTNNSWLVVVPWYTRLRRWISDLLRNCVPRFRMCGAWIRDLVGTVICWWSGTHRIEYYGGHCICLRCGEIDCA